MENLRTCLIGFLLILASCARTKSPGDFIEEFINDAGSRGINLTFSKLSIQMIDIEEDKIAGRCITNSDGTKQIFFDKPYWNSSSNELRRTYVYHELGHCLFGFQHYECGKIMDPQGSPLLDEWDTEVELYWDCAEDM